MENESCGRAGATTSPVFPASIVWFFKAVEVAAGIILCSAASLYIVGNLETNWDGSHREEELGYYVP